MADGEKLITIDDGARLMIRGIAHPSSREPAEVARAIGEIMDALAEHCPDRHFIKHTRANCDGLREGIPRGTRYHVSMIFEPYPAHYKRGDQPHGEDDGSTNT